MNQPVDPHTRPLASWSFLQAGGAGGDHGVAVRGVVSGPRPKSRRRTQEPEFGSARADR